MTKKPTKNLDKFRVTYKKPFEGIKPFARFFCVLKRTVQMLPRSDATAFRCYRVQMQSNKENLSKSWKS